MTSELARLLEPIVLAWLFAFGACVGSFLNVCIYRIPRRCLSVSRPRRSFCPSCGRTLRWQDNIPLLAWVFLQGRCAGCKAPISWRYPAVELLTALAVLALGWRHLPGHMHEPAAWGALGIHAALASALIVCAGTDLDLRIIPDPIDLSGLLLAPPLIALVPAALGSQVPDLASWLGDAARWLDSPLAWWGLEGAGVPLERAAAALRERPQLAWHLGGLVGSLLGAALGAASLYAVAASFARLLGPEAMGLGDVKLAAFLGAVAGPAGFLLLLGLAVVFGASVGLAQVLLGGRTATEPQSAGAAAEASAPAGPLLDRLSSASLPFGPFLALGAALVVLFPAALGPLRLLAGT